MIYANSAVINSAVVNPGIVGGNVWRGFKSIDQTQPAFQEPAPASALWDGGEAMSPIARASTSWIGRVARAAALPLVFASALLGFQAGCVSIHSRGTIHVPAVGVQCNEASARRYVENSCRAEGNGARITNFSFDPDGCYVRFTCSNR